MSAKVGRNDPCPCGSGKKFKSCCLKHPGTKKKFKAKLISGGNQKTTEASGPDLLERTFGNAIASANEGTFAKKPEEEQKETEGENS